MFSWSKGPNYVTQSAISADLILWYQHPLFKTLRLRLIKHKHQNIIRSRKFAWLVNYQTSLWFNTATRQIQYHEWHALDFPLLTKVNSWIWAWKSDMDMYPCVARSYNVLTMWNTESQINERTYSNKRIYFLYIHIHVNIL